MTLTVGNEEVSGFFVRVVSATGESHGSGATDRGGPERAGGEPGSAGRHGGGLAGPGARPGGGRATGAVRPGGVTDGRARTQRDMRPGPCRARPPDGAGGGGEGAAGAGSGPWGAVRGRFRAAPE